MCVISEYARVYPGAVIEEGATIHDFAVIYPDAVIKAGAEVFEYCIIGRQPKSPGCTSRKINRQLQPAVIGENSVLSPGCIVYAGTTIGQNTLLGDHCSIREECRIGDFCLISRNVSVNYHTTIGSYTKIMDNTHITGNMVIEDHVFISTLVATTNDNTMGRKEYSEEHVKGAYIKSNTTIGAAANILPGITIGKNCIVAAGAVVTKSVSNDAVVMGIPARVVRENGKMDERSR